MTQKENKLLGSNKVDRLATLVEEATRATKESPKRFLEPARGTLDRAKARRHHIVFGRRGSGKTSLLRKASADLTLKRIPIAFVDLESFKGHAYPDVLLSILIETLHALDQWLTSAGIHPASKTSFWKRIWNGKPDRPPLDKNKVEAFRGKINKQIEELNKLLHSEDQVEIKATTSESSQSSNSRGRDLKIELAKGATASYSSSKGESDAVSLGNEITESSKRNKNNYLLRKIIDFQKIFEGIVELSGTDTYIFLDDLYHISRKDQAHVLDYFHRILKGRSVWLKVGTIRHRTEWYHHGDPPTGLKLGDDCDDIDLDITLEKYEIAKKFLLEILDQLFVEAELSSHSDILADGGIERLVLASGGVARDFLTIFRKSIDVARERGETYRGERINAEDVNMAAGEHEPAKRDELKRDTLEERAELEYALQEIQKFCIGNAVNCFLVDRAHEESKGQSLLGELADLRFVHVADSRTTVRDSPGRLFTAYMLDVSQYTGARTRRDLEMISFWRPDKFSKIRRLKYAIDLSNILRQDTRSR